MDAKGHSEVWRTVGNDLGDIAKGIKKDVYTKQTLGALALFATMVGTAYHKKAKEESDAGPKV